MWLVESAQTFTEFQHAGASVKSAEFITQISVSARRRSLE